MCNQIPFENHLSEGKVKLIALSLLLPFMLFPNLLICQNMAKTEQVTKFKHEIKQLEIKSPLKIILTTDASNLISVFGTKKAVKAIRIKEKNGKLTLRRSFFAPSKYSPFIVVSVPALEKLLVLENATIESSGLMRLTSFEVVVNADANVCLRVDADVLNISLKGNGAVNIEGYFQRSEIRKDLFGWCHVQYHRVAEAIVSDPHN